MRRAAMAVAVLLFSIAASRASAQTAADSRAVVFADAGVARTWDDEGLLGTGMTLGAGAGYRVTPRTTIQAIVDRIPYHLDYDYLAIDGRVLFAGVEAAFQSARGRARRFVTVGGGLMDDRRAWITRSLADTRLPRVVERSDFGYTLKMFTASAGLNVLVSGRASIRAAVRLHGLLDTGHGRDLAPHTIVQPTIGTAIRW